MYNVDQNMESDSRRHKSPGMRFQQAGMARGIFENNVPKHRFTDYSKAEMCFKMIESSNKKPK